MRVTQYALAVGALFLANLALAAPPVAEVGDADSFGHDVKYIGAKSTPFVFLNQNCASLGPINDRCININPVGATVIDQTSLASFRLPGSSTRTLICHSLSTFVTYRFLNNNTVKQQANFLLRPVFTVESTLLNNPAFVDPVTNLPLNGKIVAPLGAYTDTRSLTPGDDETKTQAFGRDCTGGIVSRAGLQSYGMSSFQIAAFFASPITVTLSATGSIAQTDRGGYQFGVRLYGD